VWALRQLWARYAVELICESLGDDRDSRAGSIGDVEWVRWTRWVSVMRFVDHCEAEPRALVARDLSHHYYMY
jgi:hypothetical protein